MSMAAGGPRRIVLVALGAALGSGGMPSPVRGQDPHLTASAMAPAPKPPLPVPLVASRLRIQAFGDVALITFEVVRPTELARRTLVAHREGSEWRIVHIHASSADVRRNGRPTVSEASP